MDSVTRDSPSRAGRRTPLERQTSIRDGKRPAAANIVNASTEAVMGSSAHMYGNATASPSDNTNSPAAEPIIQRPAPVAVIDASPARGRTASFETPAPIREAGAPARSSIAKLPLHDDHEGTNADADAAPLRSIFPEYNPNVPLAQQSYYPTQTSPTHIPPETISRRLYSPTSETYPSVPTNTNNNNTTNTATQQQAQSPPSVRSPPSTTARRWPPPRTQDANPTAPPEPSTTEQLRDYWKVANGWKAPGSEGRVYTFHVSCERDAPIYTLASRNQQPFYRMKLDPTSASAYVSLSRFDPTKPYKPPVPPKDSGSSHSGSSDNISTTTISPGKETSAKGWQEVLSTTLEETNRHHAPNDGLVALLFPSAAARMALNSQHTNAGTYAAAERECARLVWDDDSGSHFLVHPALAMPFCVTIERNPTWSRTEYTLEHIESPQHLARLTRDGTGTGWLEVDTGIAAKIDAVYLVDVAVAALVLIAHGDGEFSRVEVFEPPPSIGSGRNSRQEGGRASRLSRLSSRIGTGESKKKEKAGKSRLEEFELDLESQVSDLKKHSSREREGMPGCARALISVLKVAFKCFVWCATVAFKALAGLISLLARCVGVKKL